MVSAELVFLKLISESSSWPVVYFKFSPFNVFSCSMVY